MTKHQVPVHELLTADEEMRCRWGGGHGRSGEGGGQDLESKEKSLRASGGLEKNGNKGHGELGMQLDSEQFC